jgi:hypothetical protein
MASSGNGPQQSQHVQVAAEGLFARVKQVASGILAEVSHFDVHLHHHWLQQLFLSQLVLVQI